MIDRCAPSGKGSSAEHRLPLSYWPKLQVANSQNAWFLLVIFSIIFWLRIDSFVMAL